MQKVAMIWIWLLFIIQFNLWKFVSLQEPPKCYKIYGGICIDDGHQCPFVNPSKKKNRPTKLCPDKMFCCTSPESKERYEYSKKVPNCGILSTTNSASRILGGYKASLKEFPWQVSISCLEDHECGGTLIHPQWVITAAHCKTNSRCEDSDFSLIVGDVDLESDKGDKGKQTRGIKQYIIHPDYDKVRNDIALIELDKPVKLSASVKTACLPNPQEKFDNMACVASGFGATETAGDASAQLMYLPLPIVPHDKCKEHWKKELNKTIDNNIHICAGFDAGKRDTCTGDSGGPLVCRKRNKSNLYAYVLAGVTSFGAQVCGKANAYAVYTRTSNFIPWINSVTSISFY